MKPQFFGQQDKPLYGVYHAPRGRVGGPARAVVVCPPGGQEYVRSHWCLKLVANQLSRKGIHVLRFDYTGTGDSNGRLEDVSTLESWRNDVRNAIAHLQQQSGAQTVMLAGLRTGASLAVQVARNNPDVNSVVLWEPVIDGAEYIDRLRQLHRHMLDLWVCRMDTPDDEQVEEILGSLYSRSLLNELTAMKIAPSDIVQPQLIARLDSENYRFSHPVEGLQYVISTDDENSWYDLRDLETAWLRPATTRTLVKKIDEMFNRLQSYDALVAPHAAEHELTFTAASGATV